jgi:glycosyltransferase involved in cell wall biosynthesis
MHIAIIGSRGYPSTYGGFETFVRRFAPYAVGQGHKVTVYGRGAPIERVIDDINVIDVPGIDSKSASTATHGLNAFLDARDRDFDVALVLNPANGPFLPLLRCPSVVNPDGLEWRRGKWGRLARGAFMAGAVAVATFATEVVVDSRAVGRYWMAAFRRSSTFIPYGADVYGHHPIDPLTTYGLASGDYALVVARLSPENNVELAVEAYRLLEPNQHLVVVGDANYNSPTVEYVAREARRLQGVRWLGRVDDQAALESLWGHAYLYIHGHSVGGTNPALLQAMGHGSAPIAYYSPFNREVLGIDSHLFDSSQSLAELWRAAINDPPRHEEWRKYCTNRVVGEYSWGRVCSAYLDVMTRAVAKGRK